MSSAASGTPAPPGAGPTRRTITAITLTISLMCFAFCFGNAHTLCINLGIEGWIAWLIGPSVDLSVIGLLLGVRHLASLGYDEAQLAKPRRLLTFCGLLTLALNTADAVTHGQFGTAAVEAIGPILLICWADVGPWLLRQIHTHAAPDLPDPAEPDKDARQDETMPLRPVGREELAVENAQPPGEPADAPRSIEPPAQAQQNAAGRDADELWVSALRLDAAHRAEYGRAITRDALRDGLRIGTDKATELNRRLRDHTARSARLAVQDKQVLTDPPQDEVDQPALLGLAGSRT